MTLFTPISGIVSDQFGTRVPLIAGMASVTIGSGLLAVATTWYSVFTTILGLLFVGAGMGVFTPPNNSQVMGCVPANRLGITGGMLNMSRTFGMGLGVTLGGLSYQLFLNHLGVPQDAQASYAQMISAFRNSFTTIASLAVIVLVLSLAYSGERNRDSAAPLKELNLNHFSK